MKTIGKYEVLKELGKGASSTVFLGQDGFTGRQVAIKLLSLEGLPDNEAEQFKKLFLTEASLAGKIEHPYIASIYDAVISDDASYLVMEYVGGGTLERYCQVDNLLPPEQVIEIIFKCCRALGYACQNGIIHRDIKPENILVVDGTDIKISDFGAAIVKKDGGDEAGHPADVGSLAYMSPQQAQGMEINHQADIYSLGVMFYRMLTGSLPFAATDDAGLLFQILHIDPPRPSTYRLDLPKRLDDLVMRSISKSLEERYQNWEEFERELVAAFEKLPREVSSFPDTEKYNTLRKLNFFRHFNELELWEVLRISQWAYYPEGTAIIHEGDETASFFIIISGEAEVRRNGRAVCTISEGMCFGEMSGVRKGTRRRSASVYAHKDIRLIEVYEQSLSEASENCQRRFDKAFLEILADRLATAGTQDKSREKTRARAQATPEAIAVATAAPPSPRPNPAPPPGNPETSRGLFPLPALARNPITVEIAGTRLSTPALAFLATVVVMIHFISFSRIIQLIF